jgi:hypothetical protein
MFLVLFYSSCDVFVVSYNFVLVVLIQNRGTDIEVVLVGRSTLQL